MVVHHITTALKQALITFTSKQDAFKSNLEVLKHILDKTTADHVSLHPRFFTDSIWKSAQKAPVTYIEIYEDDVINVGIFVIGPGAKIPLHNHPQMHGLLKVLSGKIKIKSYSVNSELTKRQRSSTEKLLLEYPIHLTVEQMDDVLADADSECCILEPDKGNIHELESIDGPAAFLDVLSPPYESNVPQYSNKRCSYFKIVGQVGSGIFSLRETPPPSWFWTDSFPYTGPELYEEERL